MQFGQRLHVCFGQAGQAVETGIEIVGSLCTHEGDFSFVRVCAIFIMFCTINKSNSNSRLLSGGERR
ncbi:gsr2545 [Gloeobacter violaceus PCC 7421]|uniref:Gsr2545 protein n=1 Tax=Gloeobacter violaceus (strain ATCC 29082 / PCC 7421) TaxID=251221 RepID=Q7NHJ0_GLOVI|nr:gsr2545 [Gloeobacter violaceus PCC 7421]